MQIEVRKADMRKEKKRLKVCAYARVSTEASEQENSLENQVSHYTEMIQSNPAYEFAGVYADFGISGFKESRPQFQKMMQDAKNGKIDLIITKSVSRFARNTAIVLKASRELKERNVGIFFELQNINTLTEAGELLLTILAAFAQAESESASESSKMAYLHRIENGEVVAYLERSYGYEKDENGEYRAKEPEASVIREIYDLVIQGVNCTNITRVLNARNIQTVQGAEWTASTVFRIVENEIYKGDVLMQKTFIDEKRHQVQNRGEKAMYYAKDNHPPIVSEKTWEKAQRKLEDMRAERAEHSVIQEFTEENYPYMNHIFCAKCGWPLKPRVYSHGHRFSWDCSGQKRGTKKFCTGIHVLDNDLRKMKIEGNRYFSETVDKYGEVHLKHVGERTWKNKHKKKKFNHKDLYPELNEENYPYYRRLYCARCGSRLGRYISHGTVRWICSSYKRKGQAKCPGVRIPDEIIKGWNLPDGKIYIMGKEDKNGEKHYSYTSESAL